MCHWVVMPRPMGREEDTAGLAADAEEGKPGGGEKVSGGRR